jgi:hypothetical protein
VQQAGATENRLRALRQEPPVEDGPGAGGLQISDSATAELAKITPDYLAKLDQEQLDQLYARLTAGPIPDGAFDGRILLPRGESGKFRLSEIVGGFGGTVAAPQGAGDRGSRRSALAGQGLLP